MSRFICYSFLNIDGFNKITTHCDFICFSCFKLVFLSKNQLELSELAGVGINTLVAIERGEGNPKLKTLLSILDTLGLQMTIELKS